MTDAPEELSSDLTAQYRVRLSHNNPTPALPKFRKPDQPDPCGAAAVRPGGSNPPGVRKAGRSVKKIDDPRLSGVPEDGKRSHR